MPVPVTCKCGKAYQVKDEFAGTRVKCPVCGKMIDVPAVAPAPVAAPGAPARMSGKKMIVIAASVNLGALLVATFILVFLYMTEEPESYARPPRPEAPSQEVTPEPAVAPPSPGPASPAAPGPKPAPASQKPPAQPAPSTPVAKPPMPAVPKPPALPVIPATPATPAAPKTLVYKADVNGSTLRVLPGMLLRFELPAKFKPVNHVAVRLEDEEKALQDLGQDKEAEKRGLYVFQYKGTHVGTAMLVVTFSDTAPGQGKGQRWQYEVRIKVRTDAPPGGA